MISINCDIGERGEDHPTDRRLMRYIRIANLACGGHAGDRKSIDAFRKLAEKLGVEISAHLSYPDPEHFGRVSLELPTDILLESLEGQLSLLQDVHMVKLHGALYNDSARDSDLAAVLASWFQGASISTVITQDGSELAGECLRRGIAVLKEAFAERRYRYFPQTERLALVSRSKEYASIHDCDEAVEQTRAIVTRGEVRAVVEEEDGSLSHLWIPIRAETVCIHSDSPISLELARRLERLNSGA